MQGIGTYPTTNPKALTPTDMNGDGLVDLLYFDNSQWRLLRATGSETTPYSFAWQAASATYTQSTDLNWQDFDNGLNGSPYTIESTKTITLTQSRLEDMEVFDYNRDGKADLVFGVDGFWRALISTGTGYDTKLLNTERSTLNWTSATALDGNGDGITDLMYQIQRFHSFTKHHCYMVTRRTG